LPNIDVAFYDLVSNQITLGYLFDRYSRRIRKTEVSFAQSIDSVMLATLNGLLVIKHLKKFSRLYNRCISVNLTSILLL